MAAFQSLYVQGTLHTYTLSMKHTQLLFVFILIYSVRFKVTVKTSYKQTTEALGIVLTSFKTKTVNDHSSSLILHIIIQRTINTQF